MNIPDIWVIAYRTRAATGKKLHRWKLLLQHANDIGPDKQIVKALNRTFPTEEYRAVRYKAQR